MAAPITHIVLAEKVFNNYFNNKNKRDFFIGTSFPDIRYLRVIDRERTHPATSTLEECIKDSSFESGMRFHILVDLVREHFMKEHGIYELIPESKYITQGVKFFEDQVLYYNVLNWVEIASYFDSILEEEQSFGIPEDSLHKWHNLLKNYFLQIPGTKELNNFSTGIGLGEEGTKEIVSINEKLKNIPIASEIVKNFYARFESLL